MGITTHTDTVPNQGGPGRERLAGRASAAPTRAQCVLAVHSVATPHRVLVFKQPTTEKERAEASKSLN